MTSGSQEAGTPSLGQVLSGLVIINNSYLCLFVFCCFTSLQHLRSYQDGYRLVTVSTHGDFIVLPHWKTGPPAPLPDIPLNHIILRLSQPVLIMLSTWLISDKYKFYTSLVWLDHGFQPMISRMQNPYSTDSDTLSSPNLCSSYELINSCICKLYTLYVLHIIYILYVLYITQKIYIYVYIYVYIYSKTSSTDHFLHRSATPPISIVLVGSQMITHTIL